MQIEYAKVSALGDRTDNQDRAAVVVADDQRTAREAAAHSAFISPSSRLPSAHAT